MKYKKYLLSPPYSKKMSLLAIPTIVLGVILIFVGFILALAGFFLTFFIDKDLPTRGIGLLVFISGIVMNLFGKFILIFGQRLRAVKFEFELIENFQPQILYLRSFKSERRTGSIISNSRNILGTLLPFTRLTNFSATTEELLLSKIFRKVGDPVAVGYPGEKLPPIGFPRIYLGDNWKEVIRELISDVEWIFIRADNSEGLQAEIEFAVSMIKDPERLVFIIPFADDQESFNTFRDKLQNLKLNSKTPYVHRISLRGTDLTGLIHFNKDWSAHVINIEEPIKSYEAFTLTVNASTRKIIETAFKQIPKFQKGCFIN